MIKNEAIVRVDLVITVDQSGKNISKLAAMDKKEKVMNKRMLIAVLSMVVIIGSTAVALADGVQCEEAVGAVYAMTNESAGNQVVVFSRDFEGMLTKVAVISTGGKGSGSSLDSLGSQGSLVLSGDGQWLLAVNAGSNEVSVFLVIPDGLKLVDKINSGGAFPVSLTVFHDLVYVLNAGSSPNISGFQLSHTGQLTPLSGSTRSLASTGAYAQVGFDSKGEILAVTDKADSEINIFSVDQDGLPSTSPVTSPSNGVIPFGFIFDQWEHLLVVEAGTNAVSSYKVLPDDTLQVISPSVPNGQKAACWIAGTARGYVFTANPGTSTVSSYQLKVWTGVLSLLDGTAGTGKAPLDLVTVEGRFLYTLDPGSGGIDMFKIEDDGDLTNLGTVAGGLSIFAQGIAAR